MMMMMVMVIKIFSYVIVFPPGSIVTSAGFFSLMLRFNFRDAIFLTSSVACSGFPFMIASLKAKQRESKRGK